MFVNIMAADRSGLAVRFRYASSVERFASNPRFR